MKAQAILKQRETNTINQHILMLLIGICMIASVGFNNVFAQTNSGIEVKGMVSDEIGPLTGVNIVLEGSNVGVITDTDGTFIFPKALQIDDVLVFSYLGYETRRIKIKEDSAFLNIKMVTEAIDIVGAPAIDIPYKSKRTR